MILAAVAVLVVALLGVLFLVFRKPGKPVATPAADRGAAPGGARADARGGAAFARRRATPSCAGSLQALSSHPELARWLAQNALVRTLTAVVDNVANGETPRPHLEFLAPKQRFKAARRPPRQIVPDPAGFQGYDVFADGLASVDAGAAAATFRTLAPLFEAAYVELGHPGRRLPEGARARDPGAHGRAGAARGRGARRRTRSASATRTRHSKRSPPAQKQFLRIGPRNVRIVQGKLRELQAALAPSSPPRP